ncbi:MAG: hypothetical protein WB711_20735 [Terriglobales bacterium]
MTNKIIIGLLAVLVLIAGTIAFNIQQTKSREEAVRKHDRMMDQQLCKAVFADENGHWQEKQECIAKRHSGREEIASGFS